MENLLNQFLDHLRSEKARTRETIEHYRFYLERFLKWSKIASPDEITADLIKKYRLWLSKQMNGRYLLDKSTQNYYLIALRSFVRYLNENDKCHFNPKNIFLDKCEKKAVAYLELEEIERLLNAPLLTAESKIVQLRDRALIELLFCAGLKVSEAVILKKTDLNLNREEFLVYGRFNKPRSAILSNQAKFALKNYLAFRKDRSPYLFVRHDKAQSLGQAEHLTPRSVQRSLKQYARLAGLKKKVTPQTLRHTFTYLMFNEGADLEQVQRLLGHLAQTSTQHFKELID